MTRGERRARLIWAAWRVAEDGSLELSATLEAEDGRERELWSYDGLEEAAGELGSGLREVVERALADGHRHGRWRP